MKLNINNNTLEKIDWDRLDQNEIKLIHHTMDYLSFNPVGIEPISKVSNQVPNEQYLLAMFKNVFSEEEKKSMLKSIFKDDQLGLSQLDPHSINTKKKTLIKFIESIDEEKLTPTYGNVVSEYNQLFKNFSNIKLRWENDLTQFKDEENNTTYVEKSMFLNDENKLAEPANKKDIETFCSLLKDEIKATVIPKIFNEIVSKINQNYKHQTSYKRGLLKGDINNRDRLAHDIYAIKNGVTTIKELPSFKNRNHKDQDKILKGEISKTHYGNLKELMECVNLSKDKDALLKTFENHIDSSFKSKLNMLEKENSPDVRNNPTPTN